MWSTFTMSTCVDPLPKVVTSTCPIILSAIYVFPKLLERPHRFPARQHVTLRTKRFIGDETFIREIVIM